MREEYGPREALWGLEERGRELEQLHLKDDLVNSAATLFANAEAAHQRGQRFVAGNRRRVHKALGIYKRHARISDLDTGIEYLHHWPCAGDE